MHIPLPAGGSLCPVPYPSRWAQCPPSMSRISQWGMRSYGSCPIPAFPGVFGTSHFAHHSPPVVIVLIQSSCGTVPGCCCALGAHTPGSLSPGVKVLLVFRRQEPCGAPGREMCLWHGSSPLSRCWGLGAEGRRSLPGWRGSCCTPPRRPWGQPGSGACGSGLGTKWGCCRGDKCIMSWAAGVGSHC